MVNKDKESNIKTGKQHNTLTSYLGNYVKYRLDNEVTNQSDKQFKYSHVKVVVDDDMIKLVNIIPEDYVY